MSLTKFQLVTSGTTFFYDNENNGLYDTQGAPLSKPWQEPSDWADLKDRFGTDRKSKKPETIKVTLGHGCNYSCGYCMQKDIGNPNERSVNGLTPLLIKNIRQHLDTNELTRFELWGGETLLYWKDMMPIMEEFDREGITWYIPTNGTPLMMKHIDFFMQLKGNVAMGISHDGPAHESTRGKEFLHKKVDIFQRINEECGQKIQYSFNPVISRTNYDLFKINDFFVDFFQKNGLKQKGLSFELGRVYDETMAKNSTHHVINNEHIPQYKEILTRYLDQHNQQYQTLGGTQNGPLLSNNLYHTGMGVLPYARSLQEQKVALLRSNCGVDDSRLLSMDMNGNVRTCQNTDETFTSGNLMHIKGIRIKRVDLDRDSHCGTCEVRRLCKSSCPLSLGTATHYTNCAVEKTHYRAIQLAAFKLLFKDDVIVVRD